MAFPLARGDIVLTRFPFSDMRGSAVRPALVVSQGAIGQDVILVAISSVLRGGLIATDFLLEPSNPEFGQTGLRVASVIRCHKIGTIEVSHLIRRLGKLGPRTQGRSRPASPPGFEVVRSKLGAFSKSRSWFNTARPRET